MKIILLTSGALAMACTACNNPEQGGSLSNASETSINHSMTKARECFLGVNNQDSVLLTINRDGNVVTGSLQYHYARKDRSEGQIRGILNGDTLLADYTFMSEGVSSVREVIFVKKGAEMVEAFGDVEEQHGKMQFKKPMTGLKLNELVKLQPATCLEK